MVFNEIQEEAITLTSDQSTNPNLAVHPQQRRFSSAPDIEKNNIAIRIGSRPFVIDLVDLYARSGRKLSPELDFYPDDYRLWMIVHHVNVMQEPGPHQIIQLGYRVVLPEDKLQPEMTVVSTLPRTEFITKASVAGKSTFEADIDLAAGAKVPSELTSLLGELQGFVTDASASAKFRMSNSLSIVGRLSLSLSSAKIAAIGDGDTYSEWQIAKDALPLIGSHALVQIVLLPSVLGKLKLQCMVSATVASAFGLFPDKRRSGWVEIECKPTRLGQALQV